MKKILSVLLVVMAIISTSGCLGNPFRHEHPLQPLEVVNSTNDLVLCADMISLPDTAFRYHIYVATTERGQIVAVGYNYSMNVSATDRFGTSYRLEPHGYYGEPGEGYLGDSNDFQVVNREFEFPENSVNHHLIIWGVGYTDATYDIRVREIGN